MSKYIDADKLKADIEKRLERYDPHYTNAGKELERLLSLITSLQQEQPNNMIQWTGNNLKEVIDFTGKSPRFGEWFNSWDEYEKYVHTHNDILKLFCEDGSHYEVPVGAWIVKTPDGYNVPSVARFIHAKQELPEVGFEKELDITKEIEEHAGNMPHCEFSHYTEDEEDEEWAKKEFRYFFELGLNARKEK